MKGFLFVWFLMLSCISFAQDDQAGQSSLQLAEKYGVPLIISVAVIAIIIKIFRNNATHMNTIATNISTQQKDAVDADANFVDNIQQEFLKSLMDQNNKMFNRLLVGDGNGGASLNSITQKIDEVHVRLDEMDLKGTRGLKEAIEKLNTRIDEIPCVVIGECPTEEQE